MLIPTPHAQRVDVLYGVLELLNKSIATVPLSTPFFKRVVRDKPNGVFDATGKRQAAGNYLVTVKYKEVATGSVETLAFTVASYLDAPGLRKLVKWEYDFLRQKKTAAQS